MTVTLPYLSQGAGIPRQDSDTIVSSGKDLFVGDEPRRFTQDKPVAASTTIKDLEVVGFNASGNLVPAVYDATYEENGVRPIGIAVLGITTPSSGALKGLPIYRAGCVNIDAIEWPASFDTDAKKFAAFEGAPTPTNFVLRRVKQATV